MCIRDRSEDDASLVAMPSFHIGGAGWGLQGLYACAKNVVLKEFLPEDVLDAIGKHKISKIFLKNSLGVWHFGGTLPMKKNSKIKTCCNSSGELLGQKGLFIIDTSSFPSIPGSTIGMLTMANAYRIAKKAIV